jgi:hypothetical protein
MNHEGQFREGDAMWNMMYAGSFIEFREDDTFAKQFPMRNSSGAWSVTDVIILTQAGVEQEWNAGITGNQLSMNRTVGGATEAFVFRKMESVSADLLVGRWVLARHEYSGTFGMFSFVIEGAQAASGFIEFNENGTFSKRVPVEGSTPSFISWRNASGTWQIDRQEVVLIIGTQILRLQARFEATILTLTERQQMMGMTMSTVTNSFRIHVPIE